MSGFPRSDMPLLSLYKDNFAGRKQILVDAVSSIQRLPGYFTDNAQATKVHNDMFELYQLVNYVSYKQRVATQQFFDISFDPAPLIANFGADNVYFECNGQGQMRLKKAIIEIPNNVWLQFRAAQQNFIQKAYQRLSSDLDINTIFIPPKDAFPYKWYTAVDRNQAYETNQAELLQFAQDVAESEKKLYKERIAAFEQATKDLKKISYDNPSLKVFLLNINNQAAALAKIEPMDTLVIAMTKTAEMLRGTFPVMCYEELLSRMSGHATSSPDLQGLCKTMLTLCALAVSIGIVALTVPAFSVATGVTSTIAGASATAFAATAAYTFFAPDRSTQATGLSKAMADAANFRKTMFAPVEEMTEEEMYHPFAASNVYL